MSIPEHEHWYHIGERRCGFTVDAGRCKHWLPPAGYGALDGEGRYCCERCDPPSPISPGVGTDPVTQAEEEA